MRPRSAVALMMLILEWLNEIADVEAEAGRCAMSVANLRWRGGGHVVMLPAGGRHMFASPGQAWVRLLMYQVDLSLTQCAVASPAASLDLSEFIAALPSVELDVGRTMLKIQRGTPSRT